MDSLYLCPSLNLILIEEGFYQCINGVIKYSQEFYLSHLTNPGPHFLSYGKVLPE